MLCPCYVHVVLFCVVLGLCSCCVALWGVELRCIVLFHDVLHWIVLCCVRVVLCCVVLRYAGLNCVVMCCIRFALCCVDLCNIRDLLIVLCCVVLCSC